MLSEASGSPFEKIHFHQILLPVRASAVSNEPREKREHANRFF